MTSRMPDSDPFQTESETGKPEAQWPVAAPPEVPEHIGRYRVVKVLGEGGFGLVYLGHDDQLDRPVAIKVPHARLVSRPEDAEAYLTEARTVASLDHPNIVPVHDVGSTETFACYVVSRYVEGSDLSVKIKQHGLSSTEAAGLVASVAEALHYAHTRGLVHRDIKPANILIDAAGKPFVADFGLALKEQDLGKAAGHFGTPAYMSPEQARGEGHRVDGRTDIFSLGVVLYQLLAGKRPFNAKSPRELLKLVATVEVRPPRQIDARIPRELERICLKALSMRATDRYTAASDMADDLRHFLSTATPHTTPVIPVQGSPTPVTPAGETQPVGETPTPDSDSQPIRIVPKGLRSFDEHDADFFLELLPGPRDRDGLPDSLRFWKTRIEETDADKTFSVGLIYGPSGCGKSSLMKAGLLPRLSDDVISVYVESTGPDTETRLLNALRKRCPALQDNHDLQEALSALRRGQGIPAGRKVLIVLDQFEQWLHAKKEEQNTELVQSLRQCDGGRVQSIVMVRDDFWMAATRFMRELEVRLVEDHNSNAVDLFGLTHARKVLTAFGRAFGDLPEDVGRALLPVSERANTMTESTGKSARPTTKQQSEFLDQAIAGLAQEGKVICVRLALFAEMMKDKAWTPATLTAVGGTQGIGVNFLEETFSASTAPPEHRLHQKAARAVLKSLLPESGSNIKGHMRSHDELLEAAGYARRPRDFDDLIRILDSEIRLITPTDPEGLDDDIPEGEAPTEPQRRAEPIHARPDDGSAGASPSPSGSGHSTFDSGLFYQLTHDYLVPSLRQWLTRKQRETWRGRAELRLEERTAQWTRSRESRFLPNPLEYTTIQCGVSRQKRSPRQHALMRAATRRYATLTALIMAAITLLGWGAWEANGRIQARRLAQAIYASTPAELENLIGDELPSLRRWANGPLKQVADDEAVPHAQRLRASLAIIPADPSQRQYLKSRLLDCNVAEFPVIRDSLNPHRQKLLPELWHTLRDGEAGEQSRFHAGMALASYAAQAEDWTDADAEFLAAALLASNPDYQRELRSYLAAVAAKLVMPLESALRDSTARDTVREAAAVALAEFAASDPALLARLASVATPAQHRILYVKLTELEPHQQTIQQTLLSLTGEQPNDEFDEQQRVELGRRRAGAAITLLRMGERESFFDTLRVAEDPESLTQFVHRCRDRGVAPAELLDCLDQATEETVRFGLLLALGEFSLQEIPQSRRAALIEQLDQWYASDPHSAIHGACGWLLRKWGEAERTNKVDRTPIAYDATGKRQWFVQQIGEQFLTFIVFPPAEFQMGSPKSEDDRSSGEKTHNVRFTRPLAVSDREVTWEQYNAFDGGNWFRSASRQIEWVKEDQVAVGMTWYEAVEYCRWLTAQAGMTEEDQCYADPKDLPKDAEDNPRNWPFDPAQRGFRLLTEAEWEYVCRSGTATTFGFGSDRTLLDRYGWFLQNAEKRGHATGELRPNLRGLFDMHGNAFEWCHDWYASSLDDEVQDPFGPETGSNRLLRGGGWDDNVHNCRSADRNNSRPATHSADVGFRLCVRCGGQDSSRKP